MRVDFFPQLFEFAQMLDQSHLPTLILGLGLLVALVVLRRLVPQLPNPLIVVVAGHRCGGAVESGADGCGGRSAACRRACRLSMCP